MTLDEGLKMAQRVSSLRRRRMVRALGVLLTLSARTNHFVADIR
jgi:hypothetical protein